MPTNAEAIATVLRREGVEYVFGLPGGEVVNFLDALRREGVRFYLTGHEASAAFMADVTGQITGIPGVCVATLGPGAVNLLLGLANASLDRSPVLAFTAQLSTTVERDLPHQRLPLTRIFGSICKYSYVVNGKGTRELIEHCFHLATTPPYGPVHIALPSDLAVSQAEPGEASLGEESNPLPSEGDVLNEIGVMLREARRPLLIVGLGCLPQDVPVVRRFVEETGIPFMVTPKAKGVLPENAPGFLGVAGGMALDRVVLEILDEADLLLGVGFDPVECDKPWYVGRSVANLSRWPTAEGAYRPVEHIGDPGESLEILRRSTSVAPWPSGLVAELRARLRPKPLSSGLGLSSLEVIRSLREVFPPETVLACDVGSHKYFAAQFWESYQPQTFFTSNGLSAMGYGLPAAIAAKLCFPEKPVVALVGDGGFLMMLHNLVFLRQYRIPVIVVCLVDGSLSLIRVSQQRRGLEPYGVDFPAPDFAGIAEGFGLRGVRVDSIDRLKREVEEAVRSRQPSVLHVPVDLAEYEAYD
ncbi:MAG: thiamine pyrophosphate-binding protein [Armatimonadota bacterium]|nr:thiamine pyrophosphate-binding protein [Armatimonadota bacterium]MDR5703233.1 thiamine pyrophosphate-binding protein [Armatimonadota bacterium]